jgi:arylsulfatase A-like enzyme
VTKPFNGVINIDVRDSVPDWTPYLDPQAPDGAPNVLVVLYDDTGLAAWSPYGGAIEMPTMQRLADNGLTYSQWHTTALCSPTRSCMLTGRNHHQNGFACISEASTGFPGSHGHIPMENAYLAEVLRENGYNTFWVGKNHNVAVDEAHMGGSKRNWPLARGFDRFYGFIGGETDQWYPTLAEDNHFVEQPYSPEDGYHLSVDLADKALSFIRDSRQSAPDKPWYMFYCPGANHAPHHAPQEWIDKYKGKFDDGYEAYREWVLPRMVARGILPEDTELSELNPMPDGTFSPLDEVRPWASLSADEQRLFARMAEVYAAFSEYTDHQVGRIVDYLEASGQIDNTIILYCADNGASGEGSPSGSVNENKFFNGWPDDVAENLALIDELGSPATYNHYPTGWAAAFSAPFRMFKRYSYQGGICDPMVIHWPKGIEARGEVRNQYHHVTDVVPTLLECIGLDFPESVRGYAQAPLPGVSMAYTFKAEPDGATRKTTQYYAMLGTRGIWHDGWKAVTVHGPTSGLGHFDADQWQLFHTDVDRAEAHDLAAEHPEKLTELINLWFAEAGRFDVLSLDDRTPPDLLNVERPQALSARDTYIYYPGTLEVPEMSSVNVRGRSYKVLAEVELEEGAEGVLFAQGSRFGGHSLFVADGRLHYVYNFLGIKPEQVVTSEPLAPGKHVLGASFAKESVGEHGETLGTTTLHVDDQVVASAAMRTQQANFALAGEGLCIGRDTSDPVSERYTRGDGFAFTGGTIHEVRVSVGDDHYVDLEREAAAMMARE